jgi:hypothetical protein
MRARFANDGKVLQPVDRNNETPFRIKVRRSAQTPRSLVSTFAARGQKQQAVGLLLFGGRIPGVRSRTGDILKQTAPRRCLWKTDSGRRQAVMASFRSLWKFFFYGYLQSPPRSRRDTCIPSELGTSVRHGDLQVEPFPVPASRLVAVRTFCIPKHAMLPANRTNPYAHWLMLKFW